MIFILQDFQEICLVHLNLYLPIFYKFKFNSPTPKLIFTMRIQS